MIEVLDSRRIAEFIVQNIADRPFVEGLAPFLPFLSRLRDEWALSHQVPEVQGYVSRPGAEATVVAALRTHRLAVVTGLSGIGKSALCSAVATALSGEHELVLWQDAADLSDVEQLRAVDAYGNGERANILGYLKTRPCLLILDNITNDSLPKLVLAAGGAECRILATSQVGMAGPHVIELGPLDQTAARTILTRDTPAGCPQEAFDTIWRAVGGHPLLLSILNDLVTEQSGDWALAVEFAEDALRLEDSRRERVCVRILKQHEAILQTELQFVRWAGTAHFDAVLLRDMCGATSEYALRRRHFLAGQAPGTVRVHDLVFRSVLAAVTNVEARARQFTAGLAQFVVQRLDEVEADRLRLARVARMHHALFVTRLADSSLTSIERAAFRYAWALGRAPKSNLALLGDPMSEAIRLASSSTQPVPEIEVRAVIETIEAGFALTKQQHGQAAAVERHRTLLPAFGFLRKLRSLPPELARDVLLHEAKALLWSGDKAGGEAALRSLVASHPNYGAAHLQLGRVLSERAKGRDGADADGAITQFTAIMALDSKDVPVTVSLAAFEFLRNTVRDRALATIRSHKARLLADLREAGEAGLDQPFQVVAMLGAALWFNAPDLMEELYGTLPARSAAFDDASSLFPWAQVQKYVAKARLERGVAPEIVRPLLLGARVAYEQVPFRDEYRAVQYAECLILAAFSADALTVLDAVGGARSVHWYHRSAQALRACGDSNGARSAIDHAIANNTETRYRAAFLRERWLIRQSAADEFANQDLEEAIRSCEAGRFRDQLEHELASLAQASPAS